MTIIIIGITVLISIAAFNNKQLFERFQFNAYRIYHQKELYRILTHGFLHANYTHLIYSHFMGKKQVDNINHDAHLLGAIFGFVFPLLLDVRLINHFIHELLRM